LQGLNGPTDMAMAAGSKQFFCQDRLRPVIETWPVVTGKFLL
jgi:hypothetical protein